MSSRCQNSEVITGPIREVCILYLMIHRWSTLYNPDEDAKDSLDVIRRGAGLEDKYNGCNRGYFMDIPCLIEPSDSNKGLMVFCTETAYSPVPELWRDIIKRWAPNCQYYYLSICADYNEYVKYDPDGDHFPDNYYVGGFVEDESKLPKCFQDILDTTFDGDTLFKLLKAGLSSESEDLNQLIDRFNNTFEDTCCDDEGTVYNSLKIYPIKQESDD